MILTVDDDNEVNYVIYRMCKDLGIPTVNALSYKYAAEILVSAKVKLVLCDMMFGDDPLGGIAFIELLREKGLDIPVAIISNNPDPDIPKLALDNGAIAFIEKPVSKEKIKALYDKAVEEVESKSA